MSPSKLLACSRSGLAAAGSKREERGMLWSGWSKEVVKSKDSSWWEILSSVDSTNMAALPSGTLTECIKGQKARAINCICWSEIASPFFGCRSLVVLAWTQQILVLILLTLGKLFTLFNGFILKTHTV